ncbi:lipopolysaccharide biosynthesis protein [Sphingomonas sp. SRS2]|uniref:lipopolysaccharide biosynthesis protein n=1 Tax=Sphingomonas sp. SRS2 TaxID=133190 RepID=UPI0006184267|nr:lipopolysaccharide biosynthesis protein [Sphingomonas sp. SRS2]KKC26948.1 capsular biosynthesis protein [Sphingomonas sp. SRS2]
MPEPPLVSRFDPDEEVTKRAVGRGAMVTAFAQGLKFLVQFISVVALSRLLAPEQFGIMAMATPFFAFLILFQDLGLTQATIQRQTISHAVVNYLFWINMAAATMLALLLLALSPLVAWFYSEPRVGGLVAAMSVLMMVYAAGAQHSAILSRKMKFQWLAVIEVSSAAATVIVTLLWALVDQSYWALYFGTLAGAITSTSAMWFGSRWLPSLPRACPEAKESLGFGASLTGSSLANFASRNLDNVLIGKVWGSVQLGLYDRAYKLLLFPLSQITNPLSRVMVPSLSRLLSEPERYRSGFLAIMPLILFATLPGVAFAGAMSDRLVPFALGEQWTGSAPIFSALAFAGLLQPLNNPAGWLFISQGRGADAMKWALFTAACSICAFALGLPYGALGVAIAISVSEYLRTPLLWAYVGRRGPVKARDILRIALPFVTGAHISMLIIWLVSDLLPEGPVLGLISGLVIAYGATLAIAYLFPGGRAAIVQARSSLAHLRGSDRTIHARG